jgi:hypothetical protein
MRIGRTEGPTRARPLLLLDDGRGALPASGLVAAAYVHGLFADVRSGVDGSNGSPGRQIQSFGSSQTLKISSRSLFDLASTQAAEVPARSTTIFIDGRV